MTEAAMTEADLLVPTIVYFVYMTLLWAIGLRLRNAGLVDFGWPSGFTALAVYYAWTGEGAWERRWLIAGMYVVCGARFMLGWVVRNARDGEDRHWQFWRDRWQQGDGLFGLSSVPLNLFAFYHAQTFYTLFLAMAPVILACQNERGSLQSLEWAGVGLWIVGFALENVADFQLDRFRARSAGSGGVCQTGLWRYSRHPNYFFEFTIWCAYALFAMPSAESPVDFLALALLPIAAYWFLVHNSAKLMSGKPRCTLWMHPCDAESRGIHEGDDVRITSEVGAITAPVHPTEEIMPGVVSLPHGFGHGRDGVRLGVAEQPAGASINDLTDHERIDELSGNAAFCGTPVEVTPVRATQ